MIKLGRKFLTEEMDRADLCNLNILSAITSANALL
jgi:hypothetical protein